MPHDLQAWSDASWLALGLQYLALVGGKLGTLYLIGLVFYFVERFRPAQPDASFFKRDFKTELCYPLFNLVVGTPVFTLLLLLTLTQLLQPFAPHHVFAARILALPFAVQVFAALLVTDLAVYVEHRVLAHGPLWDYHALHHMTPEVSWLTAVRVHPVNAFTIALTAAVMSFVFGFDGRAVVVAAWISTALANWEHANIDFGLPRPLCYLLVSPRYHRWHHAQEPEAVDKNFCLIFPFLDLLFGTYYCPDRLPQSYGIHGDGETAEIPTRFLAQLRYPFEKTLERIRSVAGVGSVSTPP